MSSYTHLSKLSISFIYTVYTNLEIFYSMGVGFLGFRERDCNILNFQNLASYVAFMSIMSLVHFNYV